MDKARCGGFTSVTAENVKQGIGLFLHTDNQVGSKI